jgi:hypothetical protein
MASHILTPIDRAHQSGDAVDQRQWRQLQQGECNTPHRNAPQFYKPNRLLARV